MAEDIPKPRVQFESPKHADILAELAKYGVKEGNIIKLIDSTRDAADIRLNYIVDKNGYCAFATRRI